MFVQVVTSVCVKKVYHFIKGNYFAKKNYKNKLSIR